jgi:BioD-like phosphotransacetylase family protein
VEVVGAVVNKVDADAHPSLPDILRQGLARHGVELLGTLPYRPLLSNPTLSMLVEQMPGEVLNEGSDFDRTIEHVAIGAMQPRHLLERIGPGSLLIVPGDREDVIQATIAANRTQLSLQREPGVFDRLRNRSRFGRRSSDPSRIELAGMVFTGGYRPRPRDLEALKQAGLFGYLVDADTYGAASEVHDLLVKTHPSDRGKIAEIRTLVADNLDVDRLLERFDEPRAAAPRNWQGTGAIAASTSGDGRADPEAQAPTGPLARLIRGLGRLTGGGGTGPG